MAAKAAKAAFLKEAFGLSLVASLASMLVTVPAEPTKGPMVGPETKRRCL